MEQPQGLRLISTSELRSGDLVSAWMDGENCHFNHYFIISVSGPFQGRRKVKILYTTRDRGVGVDEVVVTNHFVTRGILCRSFT